MPQHNPMVGSSGYAQSNPSSGFPQSAVPLTQGLGAGVTIDGTPVRVVALLLLATGVVILFKVGNFKFHVTVGN